MKELELQEAFTLIEPGPVTMITTSYQGKQNVMTISWTMVLDFTPQFAFMTGSWNYSYEALVNTKECVIAIPTIDILDTVINVGTTSGSNVDKFSGLGLTPLQASIVGAPLIKECYANIECRITDYIEKHGIFVLDAVKAWIDEERSDKRTFHAIGDGTFVIDGEKFDRKKQMREKLPPGV